MWQAIASIRVSCTGQGSSLRFKRRCELRTWELKGVLCSSPATSIAGAWDRFDWPIATLRDAPVACRLLSDRGLVGSAASTSNNWFGMHGCFGRLEYWDHGQFLGHDRGLDSGGHGIFLGIAEDFIVRVNIRRWNRCFCLQQCRLRLLAKRKRVLIFYLTTSGSSHRRAPEAIRWRFRQFGPSCVEVHHLLSGNWRCLSLSPIVRRRRA